MPQPISHYKLKSLGLLSIEDAVFDPEQCAKIVRLLSVHAKLEGHLARIFARMLHTQAQVGAAMYNALAARGSPDTAVDAAAEVTLTRHQLDVYQGIKRFAKQSNDTRHSLAHAIWVKIGALPDKMIFASAKGLINTIGWVIDSGVGGKPAKPAEPLSHDEFFECSAAELDNTMEQIEDVEKAWFDFERWIWLGPTPEEREKALQRLLGRQSILSVVNRIRGNRGEPELPPPQ